jgi:hypothetical protein
MAIQIQGFRKYEKNSLKGFVTLQLPTVGLEIRDCTVHEANGKRWVGLPAKPYQDKDGSTKYSYIVSFPDKKIYGAFQDQALQALDEYMRHHDQGQPEIPDDDIPF